MLLKYQHAPQELWIRDNSIKQCSPTNGEDPTCLKGTSTFNIDDHLNYFYISKAMGDAWGCDGTHHP
jgi:hypothetical protein